MNYQFNSIKLMKQGAQYDKNTKISRLQYAVGALLYTPANHKGIARDIITERYQSLHSLALCLEDAVADGSEMQAEQQLIQSLQMVYQALDSGELSWDKLPLIFVRVRDVPQLNRVCQQMGRSIELLTGVIVPKFSQRNALPYQQAFSRIAANLAGQSFYMMPVLESGSILQIKTRMQALYGIKEFTDQLPGKVLNIRVGGNDFSSHYGFRRNCYQTIYDSRVIANALSDIVNVFAKDYVISGPVWEYFGQEHQAQWLPGLTAELKLDQLGGFIGKTAIHPSQLAPIQESLLVEHGDYLDAQQILNWDNKEFGVQKSCTCFRMNEVKVHQKWAKKVMALADIYGIKAEG